jgi:hypothetical protein
MAVKIKRRAIMYEEIKMSQLNITIEADLKEQVCAILKQRGVKVVDWITGYMRDLIHEYREDQEVIGA